MIPTRMNHELNEAQAQKRGMLFVLICIVLHVLSEPGRAVHIIHIDSESAAVLSDISRSVCRNA